MLISALLQNRKAFIFKANAYSAWLSTCSLLKHSLAKKKRIGCEQDSQIEMSLHHPLILDYFIIALLKELSLESHRVFEFLLFSQNLL
jgi:hypothetical protein